MSITVVINVEKINYLDPGLPGFFRYQPTVLTVGILNKSNRNNDFNRFCKSRNNIHNWIDLVVRFISFTETDESVI